MKIIPHKRSAVTLGLAWVGLLSVVAINSSLNSSAMKQCRSNLYVLLRTDTGVGPAYQCKSRLQVMGPPAPLKD